jgi:hypothetical protein
MFDIRLDEICSLIRIALKIPNIVSSAIATPTAIRSPFIGAKKRQNEISK